MAGVIFRNVKKVYGSDVVAVHDFTLEVADKEFVVFVGPSGCGKSTTLRMVAGLEEITAGEIYIGERKVNNVLPKDRDVSMVFQNYALFPHMTVYNNIAFALKRRHVRRAEIERRVREAADILDITELLRRKPKALSGGQRQRVAIGRSIVREPQVFLMDEPLSNLDAKLRTQMRMEILKLRQRVNTTFIYVTHDQTEAMTLGDRIVVMKDGLIQQAGTPAEVYSRPVNQFVAGFIGTPTMNFIPAELDKGVGGYAVKAGGYDIRLSEDANRRLSGRGIEPGTVTLGIRPEHLEISESGICARVDLVELLGSTANVHAVVGETELVAVKGDTEDLPQSGDILRLCPIADQIHLFDRETGESLLY